MPPSLAARHLPRYVRDKGSFVPPGSAPRPRVPASKGRSGGTSGRGEGCAAGCGAPGPSELTVLWLRGMGAGRDLALQCCGSPLGILLRAGTLHTGNVLQSTALPCLYSGVYQAALKMSSS